MLLYIRPAAGRAVVQILVWLWRVLGPVEYTGGGIMIDAFFEQDTALVPKHCFLDT